MSDERPGRERPVKYYNPNVIYTYDVVVFDLVALAAAVAVGDVPRRAVQPNMEFLNAQVRALRELLHYPGVRVVKRAGVRQPKAKGEKS